MVHPHIKLKHIRIVLRRGNSTNTWNPKTASILKILKFPAGFLNSPDKTQDQEIERIDIMIRRRLTCREIFSIQSSRNRFRRSRGGHEIARLQIYQVLLKKLVLQGTILMELRMEVLKGLEITSVQVIHILKVRFHPKNKFTDSI